MIEVAFKHGLGEGRKKIKFLSLVGKNFSYSRKLGETRDDSSGER